MSDEERDAEDVNIGSADDDEDDDNRSNGLDMFDVVIANPSPADKRAHHNALERKRRDHIKESFCYLRDCVPNLSTEKASRALILKRSTEYIKSMKSKNLKFQMDIDAMRQQNKSIEQEVAALEKIKATSDFSNKSTSGDATISPVKDEENDQPAEPKVRRKRLKS